MVRVHIEPSDHCRCEAHLFRMIASSRCQRIPRRLLKAYAAQVFLILARSIPSGNIGASAGVARTGLPDDDIVYVGNGQPRRYGLLQTHLFTRLRRRLPRCDDPGQIGRHYTGRSGQAAVQTAANGRTRFDRARRGRPPSANHLQLRPLRPPALCWRAFNCRGVR